jgi:hypothetical protein
MNCEVKMKRLVLIDAKASKSYFHRALMICSWTGGTISDIYDNTISNFTILHGKMEIDLASKYAGTFPFDKFKKAVSCYFVS